jgi:hypothetical protein
MINLMILKNKYNKLLNIIKIDVKNIINISLRNYY